MANNPILDQYKNLPNFVLKYKYIFKSPYKYIKKHQHQKHRVNKATLRYLRNLMQTRNDYELNKNTFVVCQSQRLVGDCRRR